MGRLALLLLLVPTGAFAARKPEVVVVGAHVANQDGDAARGTAEALAAAVSGGGKLVALSSAEVSERLSGRQDLVVEDTFLRVGRQKLEEGRILYERADFEGSVASLNAAVQSLEDGLLGTPNNRDLIDSLLLLGLALVGNGDEDGARAAFGKVVLLDPTRELDRVNYAPGVVSLFAEVRAAVQAQPKARLTIVGEGSQYVDGIENLAEVASLLPGVHHVLVVAADGRRDFATLSLDPGQRLTWTAALSGRSLGAPASTADERSEQTAALYKSLGTYANTDLVMLAGESGDGKVVVQLYEPRTGNFSKEVSAEAGSDPEGALLDLVPSLLAYVSDQGKLRSDRISPRTVPLDRSTNRVLTDLLLRPAADEPVAAARGGGLPWYLWAGAGVAVAGGVTGLVIGLSGDEGGEGGEAGNGGDGGGGEPVLVDKGTVTIHAP